MGRSWPDGGNAALLWATMLSVVGHASLFCLKLAPREGADGPVSRIEATLLVAAPDHVQTPPRRTIQEPLRPHKISAASASKDGPGLDESGGARVLELAIDRTADYYAPDQLDQRAFPLKDYDFEYPDVAGEKQQGTLELTLYVGATGRVDHVRIDFAEVDQRIVDLAIESLRGTPFSAGQINGQAVGARLRLAVDYALVSP